MISGAFGFIAGLAAAVVGASDSSVLNVQYFAGVVGLAVGVLSLERGVDAIGRPSHLAALTGRSVPAEFTIRDEDRRLARLVAGILAFCVAVAGYLAVIGATQALLAFLGAIDWIALGWFAWAWTARRRKRRRIAGMPA